MKLRVRFLSMIAIGVASVFSGTAQTFDGYALYNKQNENTAYLIDKDGNIAHSWSCADACNYTVNLKDNGNIVRGAVYPNNQLFGGAVGGTIQELDANANIVWEFDYSSSSYCQHHDLCVMPNGNVLIVAWEVKSASELTQAGYDGASSDKWPTHILELQPSGSTANIVWEWHIWDHLIQDHDASKDNYGVVADHPELMDINAVQSGGGPGGPGGSSGDWFHVNGIDYNEQLDQIVFSSRTASEIYIIDHSTTTAEAASHSGGNSGMGGDFLYRWGNPSNYGASGSQTIDAAVHDPRWIPDDGRPRGGYIQFFNNEGDNGGSAVDAIDPPVNGYTYTLTPGQAYGPSTYDFRHSCNVDSDGQSASDAMSNGNTFVNVSNGYMYEVDANDNVVWQYNAGPAKAFRYECDHPGIIALLGDDPCGLGVGLSEMEDIEMNIYPNPSTGVFNLEGLEGIDAHITVRDTYGKMIAYEENVSSINLSAYPNGFYYVTIVGTDFRAVKKVALMK